MANFELYQPDNTTPIAVAQPRHATWEEQQLGSFANGAPRVSRYRRVEWRYDRLSAAEYQVFVQNRPASGALQFKTFVQPIGGTAASYVKCSGVMRRINSGRFVDGEYLGITVVFERVEIV